MVFDNATWDRIEFRVDEAGSYWGSWDSSFAVATAAGAWRTKARRMRGRVSVSER